MFRTRFYGPLLLFALVPVLPAGSAETVAESKTESPPGDAALVLFERRILPILKSPKPSSCAECHLSGVDLKDYIRPSQRETFASLVRAGLVDLKQPDQSKILTFIARKPERPGLVREDVRKEEYAAFRAWITAAASDPKLRSARASDEPFGPTVPIEVLRHARSDRVLASFIENVWSEVGRCAACHSPETNAEQVQKHGEQVSWITPGDPDATMRHMLDAGIIDVESPEASLLLTKPTEQVKHGGGQKMVVGDRSYKQFRRFLDDYAATVAGTYRTADELPRPSEEVSQVSDIWFKLTDVPAEFDGKLLQVDLYRREGNDWSQERWAKSDRPVFSKGRLWQHSLSLTAPRDSRRAAELRKTPTLPPGRYLVTISVDQTGKLAKDFRAELGPDELVGQIEVKSDWTTGYGKMTVVPFPMSAASRRTKALSAE